ncbi:sushi, von Willebrand factor type A, EGF and pentraxin domain-containing protein 1-like [Haliotis rubra]|uniref:sushi, von Willebrand factor type A, EGF and pentraxin domain-containing protein 1-like n=1 Tax=Haliotis rubra TaxID=36100 RepID=UPI001EE5C49D|nr:sushi, von Willebrand factor type A, EGF and pentraxin domain-containing protein 1-like [Haliotis rubra]
MAKAAVLLDSGVVCPLMLTLFVVIQDEDRKTRYCEMIFLQVAGLYLFTLLVTIPGCTSTRMHFLGHVIKDMEDEYRRSCITEDHQPLLDLCRSPEGNTLGLATRIQRVPQYSVCTLKKRVDRCAWCLNGTWNLASCEKGRRRTKRSFWFLDDSISDCSLFCQRRQPGFLGFISPTFSSCTSPKTPLYVKGRTTTRVTWTVPVAHDGQGKSVSVVAVAGNGRPGDSFNMGVTTFVYKATDDNGLSSFCHVTFEVKVHTCSVPVVTHASRGCDRNSFIIGTTCQFTCISGYTINGASQLTCEEGGAWSHQEPTCTPTTCPSLDTSFSCTDGFNYGSICSVRCNLTAGLSMTTPRATFCLPNGSWDLPIPDCNDTTPPTFSNCPVENSLRYAGTPVAMTTVIWNDILATDNTGNVSVTQTAGPVSGSAFPVGKTVVRHKAVDSSGNQAECVFNVLVNHPICSPPPYSDPRLRYDCTKQYDLDSQCNVSCSGGYVLDGSNSIKCQTNAALLPTMSWVLLTGSSPSCQEPKCPPLRQPANGNLSCDRHQTGGDMCTMTCGAEWDRPRNAQFDLFVCPPSTGVWTPSTVVPDCTVKRTPDEMRLEASMRLYTSSCETASGKQQLEDVFLPLINSTTFFSNTDCATTSSCSLQDVTVACVTVNRRKRSLTNQELLAPLNRYRRSETALEVTWYFGIDYVCNNMTTDACVTYHRDVLKQLLDKVQAMLNNGQFNTTVAGGHVHNDSLSSMNADFKCEEGMLPVFETGSCAVCPKGTMYNRATSSCDLCPKGSYQNEDHSFSCKICPSGTTSLDEGSTSRADCKVQCPAGLTSPNGIEPCVVCPLGEYQQLASARECLPCPRGTISPTGSTSPEACKSFEFSVNGDVKMTSIAPTTSEIVDFTLSVWYKATQLTNGTIISAGDISIELRPAQQLAVSVFRADMITAATDHNRWTRFDVTYNTFALTLYKDGKRVSSSPAYITASSSTLSVSVGSGDAITVRSVSLYNTSKTSSEILQLASTCGTMVGDDSVLSLDHMRTEGSGTITMMASSSCNAVDECLASPCNGHPCVDTPTSYECRCKSGYTGRNCSSPPLKDLCAHHQCQNMAVCKSGGSNYTCECTEGFHGLLCQQRTVNGGWSAWRDWSACSVACGEGRRTRSRSCDSPPPGTEGKDCPGPATETLTCNTLDCPVCSSSQLQLGYGHIGSGPECNSTGGAIDCRPVCREGFFTSRHQITVYTCRGGYWTPSTKLPSCIRVVSPTSMSLMAEVNYPGRTCLTQSQSNDLKTSLTQNLERITCGRKSACSIRVTVPACGPESFTTTYSHFTVNLANADLDLGSYVHNKTLSPGLVAVVDAVETLEQTARQLQNTTTTVWTVTSNGATYTPLYPINVTADVICPTGTFLEDGLCGECPTGTSYSGARHTCVPCVRGTYQGGSRILILQSVSPRNDNTIR